MSLRDFMLIAKAVPELVNRPCGVPVERALKNGLVR